MASPSNSSSLSQNGQIANYNIIPQTRTDQQPSALEVDSAGNLKVVINAAGASPEQVVGNIAAGVADSGNPVKTGGKYNASAPTLVDGQRGDT